MRASALTGAAAAVTALAVVLSGCGSDSKTTASSSSSSSSKSSETSTKTTTKTETVAPAGQNPTIADYVKENNLQETPIAMGDTTAPAVNLPNLDGWKLFGTEDVKPGFYGAAVYAGPEFESDPPTIDVIYSKLTGAADPQAILDLAPGEVNNLPGFVAGNPGEKSTLGDYPAWVLGGTYEQDGQKRLIAQKTVVIPAPDGLYVLQLNVKGPDGSSDVVNVATDKIDTDTTIG